ncbi:MAG: hypothetical protein DI551_06815 [Micavibrio aeruginosavorus]|uniref:Uncharacterized protein n=1 Tax=Micavibrio aeruginosavorus TaxID=349221 RepID=A0A2W5PT89_9BACT|nr:MAG: hypothetical protein DI551_06815 [Micavibrio aeruginosavorus]
MSISAEEIIYQHCMGLLNPNPEYYAGRGNELGDLNSSILELLYRGILKEKGASAAKSFVNMVKNLKDTNAKNFLIEYYRLERKEWKYGDPVLKVRAVKDGDAVKAPVKPQPEPDLTKAPSKQVKQPVRMTEVLNAFKRGANAIGHDKAITSDFLARHKDEVDSSLINSSFGGK